MKTIFLMAGAVSLSLPGLSASAAAAPKWTAFADCAAAYQSNAKLSNADRPASMTAQISDTASDYAKAAAKAYGQQVKNGPAYAVSQRIAKQEAIFAKQPREKVEKFIDACPQTEE